MDSGFNEPGELYLRGPQVVREFFDSGRMLDRDGWLHTGDVATVDEKGVFVIRDRIKVGLGLDFGPTLVMGSREGFLVFPKLTGNDQSQWNFGRSSGYRNGLDCASLRCRCRESLFARSFKISNLLANLHLLQAVTSIPHPSAGEAPRAFVVIDTQKTAQLASQFGDDKTKLEQAVSESLKEWTRERMARYKQPDGGIVFVSEIPKSASGKVLRRLLKNL